VHIFKQVKRQGGICLYKRIGLADGRAKGFELFKVKLIKAGTPLPGNNTVEADYEQYPGKSLFGKSALFIGGIDAEARAEELFAKWAASPESVSIVSTTKLPKAYSRKLMADNTVYAIPAGEFTQTDFAHANGMPERGKVYNVLQTQVAKGIIKALGLKKLDGGKGRGTAYFVKA
jgi:hypothetical protein